MKMKIYFFYSIFLFIFLSCHSYGEVFEITHIREIKNNLEDINSDTLFLFDIDRTLIIMNDQLLKSGKAGFLKRIKTYPSYNLLTTEEQDNLLSIVLLKTSHEIIEKDTVELIHNLQKNHIKTMAVSTMLTGRFGHISNIIEWRASTLKNVDISFQEAFPEVSEILFYPNMKRSPLFNEGILCTSKLTKGELLKLFLDKINWYPKRIIMVDDQISSLESVETELNKLGIAFQGFHYQYVEEMLKKQVLDEALITFQMDYLLKYHVWLTDDECTQNLEIPTK